jgi:hypothetical protein
VFTHELEDSHSIPFLDALISRTTEGNLEFTVYRKPTHSGRYLNFFSNNPKSHKRSVVSTLFFRAFRLCSSNILLEAELSTIHRDLKLNGYPLNYISRIEHDTKIKSFSANPTPCSDSRSEPNRICFSYNQGWSDQISRICSEFDMELTHRPSNKLRNCFRSTKSKNISHQNRNAVYKICCNDCSDVYIGESNNVSRRLQEHERDIRLLHSDNSALAHHSISLDHHINLDGFSILANEDFKLKRRLIESYFIQSSSNSMNKHPGNLPTLYIQSLSTHS